MEIYFSFYLTYKLKELTPHPWFIIKISENLHVKFEVVVELLLYTQFYAAKGCYVCNRFKNTTITGNF